MFKTLRNIAFVVLLFYVWYVLCNDKDDEEEEKTRKEPMETFVPTKDWQVVKKGQPIPPGLHVRMNLETGVTEAKLLDKDEKDDKTQAVAAVSRKKPEDIIQNSKLFTPAALKEAMKNMKSDEIIKPDDLKKNSREKFRKYEDLKKDMYELNLIPKTEVELLTEIINELKDSSNNKRERTLRLLEDLEFLVHQIDNAVEFIKQNGFTDIVYRNLNTSDAKIKGESLKLFSSLVQNNPKVKVEAVETGCISLLLKILSLDPDENIKLRATTALSCLLRRFPYAQLKFVENGGLTVVSKLFESNNIKLKVKLAALISDLLTENKDLEDDEIFHAKDQYEAVNLENLLLEQEWCENLQKLLNVLLVTDGEGHDSIEKCLLSIKAIVQRCSDKFPRNVFLRLEKHYKMLALKDEEKDEEISNTSYFNELSNICSSILNYLPDSTNKTEL